MATRECPILPLGSGALSLGPVGRARSYLALSRKEPRSFCEDEALAPRRVCDATEGRLAAYLGLRGAGEHKVQAPKVELQVHCSNSQTFFILGLSFSRRRTRADNPLGSHRALRVRRSPNPQSSAVSVAPVVILSQEPVKFRNLFVNFNNSAARIRCLDTYRTLCLAPTPDFLAVLNEAHQLILVQ